VESFKSPSVGAWKDGQVWKEGVRKVDLPTIGVHLVEDVCGFRIASLDSGGQLARIGQVRAAGQGNTSSAPMSAIRRLYIKT